MCQPTNFTENSWTRKRDGIKSEMKRDFIASKRRNVGFCFAKSCILRGKTMHIAAQNKAYCGAICSILRGKTHGFADKKRGHEIAKRRNPLSNNTLTKIPYFCIFWAATHFLSRRWPFSGVKKNQFVSKWAGNDGIVVDWLRLRNEWTTAAKRWSRFRLSRVYAFGRRRKAAGYLPELRKYTPIKIPNNNSPIICYYVMFWLILQER